MYFATITFVDLLTDTLAAATNNGQVIIWKQDSPTPTGDGWSHETTFNADGEVGAIKVDT